MSDGSGASSATMSVFQVSRMKTRLASVGAEHRVADPNQSMGGPVFGVGHAEIGEVGPELHLQIHNLNAGLPGGVEDAGGRRDGASNRGHVQPGPHEGAAVAGEVVLHVDDDHGCAVGIKGEGRVPGVDCDDAVGRIHRSHLPRVS
jgi:hypothetical protein